MKTIFLLIATLLLPLQLAQAAGTYQCVAGPASCPEMQRCVPIGCLPAKDKACFERVVREFEQHRTSVASENCVAGSVQLASLASPADPLAGNDFLTALPAHSELAQKLPSLTFGSGKKGYKDRAVVIVHGSYGVPGFMDDFVERYAAAGYNVVNCRLSGHGQRDEDLNHATLEDWRGDVRFCYDVARRIGRKVELLGHSVGASLVSDLAVREYLVNPDGHPIEHMHLLDPPLRFYGGPRWLALRPGTSMMCKPVESGSLQLMSDLGISTQSDEQRMKRYQPYVPATCSRESVPPYNQQQYLRPLCEVRKLMLEHPIRQARVDIPTSIFTSGDRVFHNVFTIPPQDWLEEHLGEEVTVYDLQGSVHALMTIADCNGAFEEMWAAIARSEP